jgi:hypothetical protein
LVRKIRLVAQLVQLRWRPNKLYVNKTMAKGSKSNKICPAGKAWARRTFDKYPSAYANMAASKYCKDPNYAKGKKKNG